MKQIPLTQGKFALVDDEDFQMLSEFKWQYGSWGYATRAVRIDGRIKHIRMHRLVMGTPDDVDIDHINGDKLDNRRENLRVCNDSQNQANIGIRKNNTTGYKGVSYNKRRNNYMATIRVNGNKKYLGSYTNPKDAAVAYNLAAVKYFGEFAYINEVK